MLVSVIVPCYNQGVFLNEALESVYNQTYSNWECIIIDDGSTDNTKKIAQAWSTKDSRFKYYYKQNNGVSSARNYGIAVAKGDFIQFLDSDDILDTVKIEASLNQLNKPENKNVGIVISNFKMISADSKNTYPPFCNLHQDIFTLDGFLFQWNIAFSIQIQCGFFNATLFKDIRFPENLSAQEDWVVWVQLMKTGCDVVFIEKTLAYYRINPKSRMRTIGIDDNQIKVLDNFKLILTYEEYYKLSVHLLTEISNSRSVYKTNLIEVKKSNPYQTGLMIKKIFKKIGLLKFARYIFLLLLKFKAK